MEENWKDYDEDQGMPVGDFQLVDVKFANGKVIESVNAGGLWWDLSAEDEDGDNIIQWRRSE